MNALDTLFAKKQNNILSIYFTAGYPKIDSTIEILSHLQDAGVDFVEIGMPFSDPLADGPVIQESSSVALQNGMSLEVLFQQLQGVRNHISMPIILMGYYNPVFKYGVEAFCKKAAEVGVDGLIIPDMPIEEYLENKALFDACNLSNILLITPQTSAERLAHVDSTASGFVYAVSSFATTGSNKQTAMSQEYMTKLKNTKFKNPTIIGFGIKDNASFTNACSVANGAIVGTQFVKLLQTEGVNKNAITQFISSIRN